MWYKPKIQNKVMEVKPYKVKEVMHLPGKKLSGKYSS